MNTLISKIQSLPEHKRYIIMYGVFAGATLAVFSLVGVAITTGINVEPGLASLPVLADETTTPELSVVASPVRGFAESFGSLKQFFVNEHIIEREKHGFSRLGSIVREYFAYAKAGIEGFMRYVSERWFTKTIAE